MQKPGEKYSWTEGILNAPAFEKGKESPLSWANLTVACNYFNSLTYSGSQESEVCPMPYARRVPHVTTEKSYKTHTMWDLRFEIGTEWLFMGLD
jgi:hypothetical protein